MFGPQHAESVINEFLAIKAQAANQKDPAERFHALVSTAATAEWKELDADVTERLAASVQEASKQMQAEMKKSADVADSSDLKLHLIFFSSCFDLFKGPIDIGEFLARMDKLAH